MSDSPRRALICGKEYDGDLCRIQLLTDDDDALVHVTVSHDVAAGIETNVWIDVPMGDLHHPAVQAGIQWKF